MWRTGFSGQTVSHQAIFMAGRMPGKQIWEDGLMSKTNVKDLVLPASSKDWLVDDRFGMVIHWGLYALPTRHEWVQSYEEISKDRYRKYFENFNPDLYDPKEWARKAREAGMKYVALTTKRYEGFLVPPSYLEAARVDGANAWQRFWSIRLPLISPTVFFATVMTAITALQVFDQIFVMTRGGSAHRPRRWASPSTPMAFRTTRRAAPRRSPGSCS